MAVPKRFFVIAIFAINYPVPSRFFKKKSKKLQKKCVVFLPYRNF